MSGVVEKLTDGQVDELGDAMEAMVAGSGGITYGDYRCTHDPARHIGVMRAMDCPARGLRTAATFGLAHNVWVKENFPDRLELVFCSNSQTDEEEKLMIVVAETIMMRGKVPKPGVIYQDAAKVAGLSRIERRMPHAMVLFPHSWPEAFNRVDMKGMRVWFLQVVPLYEDEKQFIEKNGFKVFEELLEAYGTHFENLDRLSYIEM